jgi:hypothetical protein
MTDMPTPLVANLEDKWLGPVIMFVLCFSGMMIGLAIDLQSVLPQTIVTLCTQRHSLGDSIALHATLLPATNVLMFASGLVAAFYSAWPSCGGRGAWRGRFLILLPAITCSAAMLGGMFLSEWFAPQAARSFGMTWSMPTMISAMAVGMAGGMASWAVLDALAALSFSNRL